MLQRMQVPRSRKVQFNKKSKIVMVKVMEILTHNIKIVVMYRHELILYNEINSST